MDYAYKVQPYIILFMTIVSGILAIPLTSTTKKMVGKVWMIAYTSLLLKLHLTDGTT
jgi:uncharacterized membrane protein HdeD (DUF308 family)